MSRRSRKSTIQARPRGKVPGPAAGRLDAGGSEPTSRRHLPDWAVVAGIVVLVLACFSPVLRNGFVVWDDQDMFLRNPGFRGLAPSNLEWMFSTFHMGHYQPLAWLTLALDYQLWGLNPIGYHLTNLWLHAANAVLVYLLARSLLARPRAGAGTGTDRRDTIGPRIRLGAAFGALSFAVHPLRVESVAWATERRDVLSAFFYLLTLLAYVRMQDERGSGPARHRWLAVSLCCFVLSLLSKAWGMTLPAVLLVLDLYPLRRLSGSAEGRSERLRAVLLEKIPYAIPALATALAAFAAQKQSGAMLSLVNVTPARRAAQAAFGLVFYLWKTIAPVGLSPLYPMDPAMNPLAPKYVLAAMTVLLVTAALFAMRRRWPAGLAAWAAYGLILSPVLGVAQSGPQLVADRYTYLSCLPWALLLAAGAFSLPETEAVRQAGALTRRLTVGVGAALIVALAALTARQTAVWRTSLTLWQRALDLDPTSDIIRYQRGLARYNLRDLRGALEDYGEALRLNPRMAEALTGRGNVREDLGDLDGAIADFDGAIRILPQSPTAYNNRGVVRKAKGDLDGAIADFDEAIRKNPQLAEAYNNRAATRRAMGDMDGALVDSDEALRLNPFYADAYGTRALVREAKGDVRGAIADLERALEVALADWPNRALTRQILARVRGELASDGKPEARPAKPASIP